MVVCPSRMRTVTVPKKEIHEVVVETENGGLVILSAEQEEKLARAIAKLLRYEKYSEKTYEKIKEMISKDLKDYILRFGEQLYLTQWTSLTSKYVFELLQEE